MTEQNEALRLADRLDLYATGDKHQKDIEDAAAELRRLDAELMRKSGAIQRLWAERDSLRTSMEQLLKALEPDRQLLQQALDALQGLADYRYTKPVETTMKALNERLAHCDRCGKRLGGEGDIHTCTPLELRRFEKWWDAEDDIPNDGPYTPDTPIQFAWAGWQAALAQPEQQGDFCDLNCVWTNHHPDCKLAQPEQEPVATYTCGVCGVSMSMETTLSAPVAEVVWGAKTEFEWKFKMLAELACVEDVPVKLYAGPFKGAALYWHDTETDKAATPPAASVTEFEEAVAAVDNTLHYAIDHWQDRALKAEAKLAQPEQEPVAWMFQHGETGRMSFVSNDGMNNPEVFLAMNPRYALVCALVTPPAAQPAQPEQEPVQEAIGAFYKEKF